MTMEHGTGAAKRELSTTRKETALGGIGQRRQRQSKRLRHGHASKNSALHDAPAPSSPLELPAEEIFLLSEAELRE